MTGDLLSGSAQVNILHSARDASPPLATVDPEHERQMGMPVFDTKLACEAPLAAAMQADSEKLAGEGFVPVHPVPAATLAPSLLQTLAYLCALAGMLCEAPRTGCPFG